MTGETADLWDIVINALSGPQSTGFQLRDDGIKRAVDHADATTPDWSDRAYAAFESYAKEHREFMTEAARQEAEDSGLPEPPDKRAWGGIVNRARRAGIIEPAGFAKATDPKVHASINPVWRSRVFHG